MTAEEVFCDLLDKYGEDFNWYMVPLSQSNGAFVEELKKEIGEGHFLYHGEVYAVAKCESNDDVLYRIYRAGLPEEIFGMRAGARKGRIKMEIKQLTDHLEKQKVVRFVLESLPDWFGIPEAREKYIAESIDKIFFCAYDQNEPIGFLYLKETGNATVELYVMGILKEYHRNGIGRELFHNAKKTATEKGYSFIQVKTVQMGKYEEYDRTNKFYLSLGFKEFEVFPALWDEWNPCQIYVMSL